MTPCYFLGIDGGGTKCKARLEDNQGNILAECITGPANPARDTKQAITSIEEAIAELVNIARLSLSDVNKIHAAIGLAGLNIPSCKDEMTQWKHPFASVTWTTDLHIACLGAHGIESGAVIITGTGSSGIVCTTDQHVEYGGHGFTLGDEGSGAWLGRSAIGAVLKGLEGLSTYSEAFSSALLTTIDCESIQQVVHKYNNTSPANFAELAPLVFDFAENNDPVAKDIVFQAAQYIDKLAQKLLSLSPTRFSIMGGISHRISPWLNTKTQNKLSKVLNTPEMGAVLLAKNIYYREEKGYE